MSRKTWVQDPTTGKLIPKAQYVRRSDDTTAAVMGDIEPFVSPITRAVISSRSALREHNRNHGVTDSRDYSGEYILDRSERRIKEMQGNTPQDKIERIQLLRRALDE